ncbi:hypothetical protein MITS9509_01504 [Synechococcus sp. MIT S9509]|nr:hypothetical protein MITS9504_01147 [Synechococcus sp. MIT S9504]KZR92513.1 hypothetical protein MITS9509_01504 [Synechococcus sp. MIT S9509]
MLLQIFDFLLTDRSEHSVMVKDVTSHPTIPAASGFIQVADGLLIGIGLR